MTREQFLSLTRNTLLQSASGKTYVAVSDVQSGDNGLYVTVIQLRKGQRYGALRWVREDNCLTWHLDPRGTAL